jgi:hypothetical protein
VDFLPDGGEGSRRESGAKIRKRTRRIHTPGFKAKATLAAMKGDKTLAKLAQLFDVHPNQIAESRKQVLEGAAGLFDAEGGETKGTPSVDLKALHAKTGDGPGERFFREGAHQAGIAERKAMIDREHDLPISGRPGRSASAGAPSTTNPGRPRAGLQGAADRPVHLQ